MASETHGVCGLNRGWVKQTPGEGLVILHCAEVEDNAQGKESSIERQQGGLLTCTTYTFSVWLLVYLLYCTWTQSDHDLSQKRFELQKSDCLPSHTDSRGTIVLIVAWGTMVSVIHVETSKVVCPSVGLTVSGIGYLPLHVKYFLCSYFSSSLTSISVLRIVQNRKCRYKVSSFLLVNRRI